MKLRHPTFLSVIVTLNIFAFIILISLVIYGKAILFREFWIGKFDIGRVEYLQDIGYPAPPIGVKGSVQNNFIYPEGFRRGYQAYHAIGNRNTKIGFILKAIHGNPPGILLCLNVS